MGGARLILASASPRRRELLALCGVAFDVEAADLDEAVSPGESADAYVERLARAKAAAVAQRHPEAWVLAADTSVVVDDEILGKPGASASAGAAMLERLSGRAHRVLSGVAVTAPGRETTSTVVETRVHLRALTAAEVAWYVGTGEGRDKAGGYGLQGRAGAFITAIEGSHSNVIGLPLSQVTTLLERAGFALPWSAG